MPAQIYLVGGAVRDQLLSLPIKDRDWVVVGAQPSDLIEQGYQQVGKDFPVFLHPDTKEEYALARKERKSGQGYTGFSCDFGPDVSLEQDLIRRDLTINAIAQDAQGNLHDPYGGINDLQQRILRHVSPAFIEDPLRVLRAARFAARFNYLGFRVAEETLALMQQISNSHELQSLSPERIWLETEKAFNEPQPEIYFQILHQVGALAILFPELNALSGIPNPQEHHPEIDSFVHTMMVLQQASKLVQGTSFNQSAVGFAAICHDLGKALSPQHLLPHHYGHEKKGLSPIKQLCRRLKPPVAVQELAEICCEFHTHIHRAFELRPKTILELFNHLDIWRKPQRFESFLLVCEADSRGRLGFEQRAYPQKEYIMQCYHAALSIDVQHVIADGFTQKAIREELNKRRLGALTEFIQTYRST
ncbi:multifunctional CCA addition/repair protein [Conservatibacter flavescens]|uniref:Multifunctional CCA protein n=1 Tax=Conservatibacter flavescens TaxID=28161 RepID=A0A2M8S0S1_9PAST|nr:multifunctional CCA addition/repair protein [Conservatibacter flavescens]PJG84751.1 multifunctional CCA addition/repair protein [Conservatibacter flavescens]